MTDTIVFVFSKIAANAISPLSFSIFVSLTGIFFAIKGRRFIAVTTGAFSLSWLFIWSLPVASSWVLMKLESQYPPVLIGDLTESDAIVVLGGTIVPAAGILEYPSLGAGADRVWHAARIYRAGKAPLLILTGGYTTDGWTSEAQAMKEFILALGIPEESVLLEDQSLNTSQNATNTAGLLQKSGLKEIILVTSALHMPRAKALFDAAGFQVTPAATDYTPYSPSTWQQWLPSARALDASARGIKEVAGRLVGR